jgi:SpoVK/Ycf46/Vps4 family AAA+-type ATPase
MPTTTLTQQSPEVELPPDAATTDDHRNPRRRRRDPEPETPPVGDLVFPDPRHDLDKLILHPEVKTDILSGLRALEIRADLDRIWNLSAIQPQQGRCILNFYGPPGTGKTRAALGIALRLGKPLYQVDYSAVISKYLGDTAKHIKAVFESAREQDAVLFFDEADSLLSKRVATGESCSTSINQNRNTLMQELDRFDSVVIVTTNLFENYDPALLRGIQRHIKFRLPDASMRRELFALHLPNPDRVRADYAVLAGLSRGLSGGDILNVCLNAVYAGSVDPETSKWMVTQGMLEREIGKVRNAKVEHSGERKGPRRSIGFCQD